MASYRLRFARVNSLKLRVSTRIPANLVGNEFITITRGDNGQYNVNADYSVLTPGPIFDPNTAYVAVQDQTAGIYKTVSLASLLVSGLDADIQAIAALTGTGILQRTGPDAWLLRFAPTSNLVGVDDTQALTNKSINASNNTISNLTTSMFATNVVDTDATLSANSDTRLASQKAVKTYIDTVAQGLDAKQSVLCATTANITLSGEQTIDGQLTSTSRVLVKNQSTASQNGIYVSSSGAWTRSIDADIWSELPGAFVFVEKGTVNGDCGFVCTVDVGGTIGTTAITFTQFSGAGTYTAGTGLVLTGTVFSLPSTGVTAGSYTNLNATIDAQGRITAAANGTGGGGGSGGVTVATIAALKALTPPPSGTVVDVVNFASAGDMGGGSFMTLTTSPGADNGGTIIWSSTAGTYYARIYSGDIQADWFGVRSVTNPQAQLRAAFAASAALGKNCVLPPITLDILCDLSKSPLGVLRYYAFDIIPYLRVVGTPGSSVLRIASGQSSNVAPKDLNHFLLDGVANDVYFSGIVFDSNGQNNLINGGFQSNSPINITGNAAQVTRMLVENCDFNNCAGTNNIVLGQNTNGTAGTLSRDCIIRNCTFTANGLDTSDFTAVYLWAERAIVDSCRFFQPDAQSRTGKNWVAVELHGADNWFTRSEVINYYRACWCSSNFTRSATGQWVTDNRFNVWGFGPSIYRDLSTLTVVNDVFIERNSILLRADYNTYSASDMAGVVCNPLYGVFNIYARHNSVSVTGATNNTTYGCLIGVGTSGQTVEHVYWEHNFVNASVNGLYARVNNGNGTLNEINDRYNTNLNLGVLNGTPASFGSLFFQAGTSTFNRFSCIGNRNLGDGANSDNGVYTGGTISVGIVEGNYFTGVTTQLNYTATVSIPFGLQLIPVSGASGTRTGLALAAKDRGFCFYDTTLSKVCMWSGTAWLT